jgi:biopolymer transport protein ExbB/TolQ
VVTARNGSGYPSDRAATTGSGEPVRADIESARLASERVAAILHRKMGRGRASLRAIASSALFIGILGTMIGIWSSFGGVNGEKSAIIAALMWRLAEAITPTAAGLLIAIFASWCHGYLCSELVAFDTEMRAATLELANSLSHLRQRN